MPQFLDGAIEADYTFLMGDLNFRTELCGAADGEGKERGGDDFQAALALCAPAQVYHEEQPEVSVSMRARVRECVRECGSA